MFKIVTESNSFVDEWGEAVVKANVIINDFSEFQRIFYGER